MDKLEICAGEDVLVLRRGSSMSRILERVAAGKIAQSHFNADIFQLIYFSLQRLPQRVEDGKLQDRMKDEMSFISKLIHAWTDEIRNGNAVSGLQGRN